jgi:hypothetical protein
MLMLENLLGLIKPSFQLYLYYVSAEKLDLIMIIIYMPLQKSLAVCGTRTKIKIMPSPPGRAERFSDFLSALGTAIPTNRDWEPLPDFKIGKGEGVRALTPIFWDGS